ncbi:MAG: cytochrome b5 domain-containing protein, partial [Actinobacteria bacterium]|nr:cytochrome b5 domain-containing protein [Actinomycetota bacterium]
MSSLLDTFQGLPVHPLVVHFAVVLLPLATISTMISVFIPRYRKSYAFASV